MPLPSSGTISLNQIHQEAGGSIGDYAAISDSDIRALIGKSYGAQSAFSEWHGASNVITPQNNTLYHVVENGSYSSFNGATGSAVIGNANDFDGGEANVDTYAELISAGTLAATITNNNLQGTVKCFIGFYKTNNISTNDAIVGIGQYRNGSLVTGKVTGVFPSQLATYTTTYRNWEFDIQAGDQMQYWVCSAAWGSSNTNFDNVTVFEYANIQGLT